jgi:hypothetical protein
VAKFQVFRALSGFLRQKAGIKKEGWLAPSLKCQDFDKGTHMEFALPAMPLDF